MAKLVDLLAKYLVEWPDGAEYARQDYDKEICFHGECSIDKDFFISEMSEDVVFYGAIGTTKVYMEDWLAARDRLHADTMKEMINVGGTLDAQEFDTDHALWDKVASLRYGKHMDDYYESGYSMDESRSLGAQLAFDDADAFMAERAKRLKGGV